MMFFLGMFSPLATLTATMRKCSYPWWFAGVMWLLVCGVEAKLPGFAPQPSTRAELACEAAAVAPGAKFAVALSLRHPAGWHSYYRNSGGIEQAPALEWDLPEGFHAGEIQWPVPEVKDGYFGKSFVYQGNPVFLVEITAPEDLDPAGPAVVLKARATWQICKDRCLSEEKDFILTLPVGGQTVPDDANAEWFTRARSALPQSIRRLEASAKVIGTQVHLAISGLPSSESRTGDFIPDQAYLGSVSSGGGIEAADDGFLIRLPVVSTDALDRPVPFGDTVSGILLAGDRTFAVPATSLANSEPAQDSGPQRGLPGVFLGMFLGGLILNLMPCVFPVIGLKIMGFVRQAGQDPRKVMLHGVVFTLGVLVSFAVLSTLLYLLKSSWGFQLQNPWVVMGLMVVMLLLALNMSGVFEIGTSATSIGGSLQSMHGLGGTFFSGVLATIVATPCSAPFLGSAMAAAVNLGMVPFFAAFGSMAIGLSTPYLVLSLFPGLVNALPRPGAWMESFKQAMAFPLYATAGYLLWVYAAQIGADRLLDPVFGLCVIALGAWIHGRWNVLGRSAKARNIARGLTAACAAGGLWLAMPPAKGSLDWQPWSQEAVDESLEAGKPVYIDFTATWCATCQVNKKRAYPDKVVRRMRDAGVVTYKADKTNPNPAIEKALARYGRTAIPVNVLLVPGRDPLILPELLGPSDVLRALDTIE